MPKIAEKRKIITSIADLMLADFIICQVDGDFRSLGDGTEQELMAVWDQLYDQYLEASMDEEQKKNLQLSKEVIYQRSRLQIINACLQVLHIMPDEDIILELKKRMTVTEKFDWNDQEQYIKDLGSVTDRTMEIAVDIRHLEMELKEVSQGSEEVITKTYWEETIGKVERFLTFQINKYQTSVAKFVSYIKDMRTATQAQKWS